MGMLYRRGRIWWIKYYRDRKPFRESSKSEKWADAKLLLRTREGQSEINFTPKTRTEGIGFRQLAADLMDEYRANNRKSFMWLKRRIELHLMPVFNGFSAIEITTDRARAYIIARQQQGASNGTINRELAALKRMFSLASRMTPPKVTHVPFIPMLKETNVRQGFFEHREYLALLHELPHHLKPLLTFGYFTGARKGELLQLQWCQIDLEARTAHLEPGTTKNGQARTIPLTDQLLQLLRNQEVTNQTHSANCEFVFCRRGKQIGNFQRAWTSACKRAGLVGRLFHDLRRSAVRNMVRAGVPERVAMAISGHKTRSVFDRYNIVAERDLHDAARRLEAHLSSTAPPM